MSPNPDHKSTSGKPSLAIRFTLEQEDWIEHVMFKRNYRTRADAVRYIMDIGIQNLNRKDD